MATEIFLLEDSRIASSHAVNELEALGFEVRAERDVRVALGFLNRQRMHNFTAIITDGQLGHGPDDNGMFFVNRLREFPHYAEIPIIGGSADSTFWDDFDDGNFYRIDKVMTDQALELVWNVPRVFATLADVGIHP